MSTNHKHITNTDAEKYRLRAEIAERRRQREKKKNSRRLRCLAFLIIFAIALFIFLTSAANATKISDTKTYVISTGDTLWSISEYCNTENRDVRRVMDDIMRLNKMSTAKLNVGDKLIIPIY